VQTYAIFTDAVEVWVMVRAVVETVQDIATRGPVCQVTAQFGAVTKAVPKVTTQEAEAVVPEVIVPWKSVPTRVGEPPVMQAVRTGGGPNRVVERRWPGRYTPPWTVS
jgi:hypothetical protein